MSVLTRGPSWTGVLTQELRGYCFVPLTSHDLGRRGGFSRELVAFHLETRAPVPGPRGRTVRGQQPLRGPCLSSLALPVHRQHFPFFRTAPEGWKNTIRHNLCFRHAFEKVPVSTQGGAGTGPRSCLWKLTEEGHRRFKEEARGLASTQLETIQQSMSQPGASPCQPAGWGAGLDTLT